MSMIDKICLTSLLLSICSVASIWLVSGYYSEDIEKIPELLQKVLVMLLIVFVLSWITTLFIKIWI